MEIAIHQLLRTPDQHAGFATGNNGFDVGLVCYLDHPNLHANQGPTDTISATTLPFLGQKYCEQAAALCEAVYRAELWRDLVSDGFDGVQFDGRAGIKNEPQRRADM